MECVPYLMGQLEWHRSVGHGVQLVCYVEGQIVLPVQSMVAFVRSRGPAPPILILGAGWR